MRRRASDIRKPFSRKLWAGQFDLREAFAGKLRQIQVSRSGPSMIDSIENSRTRAPERQSERQPSQDTRASRSIDVLIHHDHRGRIIIRISSQMLQLLTYQTSYSTRFSIRSMVGVSPRKPLTCAQPVRPGFI